MRRKLLGLTLGLVIAMIIIMTIESLAHRLHNQGLATDPSATLPVANQPIGLLLMILGSWLLAGLLGGGAAAYVSRVSRMAWAIAAAIMIGICVRLLSEPQPGWMLFAGPAAPLAGALLAQTRVGRRGQRD